MTTEGQPTGDPMTKRQPMTWEELLASPFRIHVVANHNGSFLTDTQRMFGLDHDQFHRMMRAAHHQLVTDLAGKGVDYDQLAKALTPTSKRKEVAYLFHSPTASELSNGFYGRHIAEAWIPALPKPKNTVPVNAIAHGDILWGIVAEVDAAMRQHAVIHRTLDFQSPQLIYCVYITNLSPQQVRDIDAAVHTHPAYLGYVDCTTRTPLKEFLGPSLPQVGLRAGDLILEGVDGDVPNARAFPFEENGYRPVGVRQDLYLPFLRFRINTRLTGMDSSEKYAALTTLSPDASLIQSPHIRMTPRRYGYLHDPRERHLGQLQIAGLADLSQAELEARLSELAAEGHVYRLEYNAEHDVLKYNVLIEIETGDGDYKSFVLVLKLHRADKRVELVTFT
ncbi:hypothetical protein [Streptomyces cinereoruber]|uniref:hypothetical protein n=1 Tax=Streptomyces cinereoruber TaxID=67260 RepID=UPI003644AE3A